MHPVLPPTCHPLHYPLPEHDAVPSDEVLLVSHANSVSEDVIEGSLLIGWHVLKAERGIAALLLLLDWTLLVRSLLCDSPVRNSCK